MEMKGKVAVKLPAKASFWYIFSSAAAKGVGIITTPIFTRLLSDEEYGSFALYMSLLGCASVICSAFNSGSATYRGLRKNANDKYGYIRSSLLLSVMVSIAICILLFALSPVLKINRLFFIPLSLQLLCDSITAVFLSFEKFYYNFKRVVAINLINAILPPAVSILLLISFDIGYFARIYSLLFISIIVSLYSIWKIVKKRGSGKIFLKEAFLYSLPMLPHAISTAVSVQADKLIIGSILGEGALGKYSVIFSMGNSLQFIVTAIGSALTPWIIRRIESGEKEKVSSLIFPMTLGYCALGSCLIAISPEALAILAPGGYFDAYPALLPIALTIPFYFISTVSTACIVYQGRAKYSLTVSAVCSVLSIILNYTLVSALGYIGAGISLLICQVISSVMSLVFLSKTNANGIIDPWRVIIATSIYIPLGMLMFAFKSSIIARSILLIIPAAILLYCLIKAKKLVIENPAK